MLYSNYDFTPILMSDREFYTNTSSPRIFSEQLGIWCLYEIDDDDLKIYVIVPKNQQNNAIKIMECIEMYLNNNNTNSKLWELSRNDF